MRGIKSLFFRYQNIKAPEKTQKDMIIVIIKNLTGISIKNTQIILQKNSIQIKAPSVVKSEIRTHTREILKQVQFETNNRYSSLI